MVFFAMFSGCFWLPGNAFYTVSISVLDSAHLNQADIDFLNRAVINEGFKFFNKFEISEQGLACTNYYRGEKYKYLDLTYCYDVSGKKVLK